MEMRNIMVQDVNKRNESYNEYVTTVPKKADCLLNCLKAFIMGGCICTLGQLVTNLLMRGGLSMDDASSYTTIILVFLSALFTGLGIYPKLANWGGAGSLVPITGFANSVASPAIEYKKEGQVFGIGCKIFTIAGPVILYGIFFSWIAGLIYWVLKLF